jgi:hypothetical protein
MARTARSARTYRVTRVEVANVRTRETFTIPGMLLTAREIQAAIDCGPDATADVRCDECGESVADCPELRGKVHAPASWSFHADAVDGVRHQDGLVIFG